jgi:hypothetical protein
VDGFACEGGELDARPRRFAEDGAEDAEGEKAVDPYCDGSADGWGMRALRARVQGAREDRVRWIR